MEIAIIMESCNLGQDLPERARQVLKELVPCGEPVRVYFQGLLGSFNQLCYHTLIVLREEKHADITLCDVSLYPSHWYRGYFDTCTAVSEAEGWSLNQRFPIIRWMLEQSDVILCNLYPELTPWCGRFSEYASQQNKRVVNLAQPEVSLALQQLIPALPQRRQRVLLRRDEGCSYRQIAEELGISASRARQIDLDARNALERMERQREKGFL